MIKILSFTNILDCNFFYIRPSYMNRTLIEPAYNIHMKETFEASFSIVNAIPTFLLVLIMIYWITVIIGVFNIETFDIDSDADTDVDVNAGDSLIWLNSALSFFNLGKIPLMIILSFFSLSLWVISILMNYYLNNLSVLLSLVYLIPSIFVSAMITKVLTTPFVRLFAKAAGDIQNNKTLTGKICTVTLGATHEQFGQAKILIEGSSFIINVLSTEKGTELFKGETCLIIDYITEKKLYLIEPYKD